MFKNIRMLLKLRSWLKSDTLKAGGAIGLLGAAQAFLQSDDGMGILNIVAAMIPLSQTTLSGLLLSIIGALMVLFRAKTEWSLDEKNEGKHLESGFSTFHFMAFVFGVAIIGLLAFASVARAEVKTFSWEPPTQYTDGTPINMDVAEYELGCGPAADSLETLSVTFAPPAINSRAEDIPSGLWFCALRVTTGAGAVYPSTVSAWSNVVNFTVTADPEAPANLTVN